MLSFLRWFVGCWHDWEKWENLLVSTYGDSPKEGQTRYCKKCGKKTWRYC